MYKCENNIVCAFFLGGEGAAGGRGGGGGGVSIQTQKLGVLSGTLCQPLENTVETHAFGASRVRGSLPMSAFKTNPAFRILIPKISKSHVILTSSSWHSARNCKPALACGKFTKRI